MILKLRLEAELQVFDMDEHQAAVADALTVLSQYLVGGAMAEHDIVDVPRGRLSYAITVVDDAGV